MHPGTTNGATRGFCSATLIGTLPRLLAAVCIAIQLCVCAEAKPPNFILVLAEGHGWSSTSVQMDDAVPTSKSSFVQTPNLERLAAGGIRFANFYAPSPRCTPSRVAVLTGKSPAQLHMTFINEGRKDSGGKPGAQVLTPSASMELPTTEVTIAKLLQHSGYATAHFGKWHMGRASPSQHGFDEHDGPNGNGGPENVANPHPKQLYAMTELGADFMTRQVKAGRPFYLQLSHYASRQGGDASTQAVETVKGWAAAGLNERQQAEAAATLDLDLAFGQIEHKLIELGIADSTYVIFTADHGTPGRNPPLTGGKGTVSEGGVRVPFIIRGPGVKPGACSHVRTLGVDLLPTLVELAGIATPLPPGVEGGSLASVLRQSGNGVVQRSREEYVVHFPHYDKDAIGPASAIYLGEFKLVHVYETGQDELFNLSKDPAERQDLSRDMPDTTKNLSERLSDYLLGIKAQMPKPNTDYVQGATSERKPDDQARKPRRTR